MRWHPGEEGASEVVGVMLLVGLTVLAVAIVAAIFLSGPQPGEIPHAAIIAGNSSGSKLILSHEGGDPLRTGEYRIYIDTGSGLVDKTDKFIGLKDGVWSIGESISYDVDTTALKRVVVTVLSGGSETILSVPGFVGGGAKFSPDPMEPSEGNGDDEREESFIDFVTKKNVFVYGSALQFNGSNVLGPGATVVITERLEYIDGGAFIAVSNIYINGTVDIRDQDAGGASFGSKSDPGSIYVNGDLTIGSGGRNIYGDVYVNGNFDLTGATMHGDVYVNGDLKLDDGAGLADGVHIYYTGKFTHPKDMTGEILGKCSHQETVPGFVMPEQGIPPTTKPAEWYTSRGYAYASSGILTNNKKIFAPSYSSPSGVTASNVVIIASDGDISITNGWSTVTGIFFAPKGRVTFNGASLEGVVIARDGLFVTSGGTTVIFKNITNYIDGPEDPENYPF